MLFQFKTTLCTILIAAFCFSASAQTHKKASPNTNKDKNEAAPNGGSTDNNGGSNSGGADNNGGNSGGSTDNNGGDDNGGNNGEKIDPKDCKMNRIDMTATKSLLERITFQSEKLETAKAQLKNKCATAAQIAEIMGLFMGEMSKGDFAKFAYNYCSDPQNYAQVENALMSEITKSELRKMYNNNNNNNNNGGNNNGGNNNGNISKDCKMNSIDMSATKPLVERIQFETEKMDAAKAQLKGKCASCAQIAEIMNLFKLDGMKLDFAEFAREYCGDPQNYIIIENVFQMEGYKSMIRAAYSK